MIRKASTAPEQCKRGSFRSGTPLSEGKIQLCFLVIGRYNDINNIIRQVAVDSGYSVEIMDALAGLDACKAEKRFNGVIIDLKTPKAHEFITALRVFDKDTPITVLIDGITTKARGDFSGYEKIYLLDRPFRLRELRQSFEAAEAV